MMRRPTTTGSVLVRLPLPVWKRTGAGEPKHCRRGVRHCIPGQQRYVIRLTTTCLGSGQGRAGKGGEDV